MNGTADRNTVDDVLTLIDGIEEALAEIRKLADQMKAQEAEGQPDE